ncbi:MAG: signal peptidase I [Acidimicrobiales bacterium]
MLDTSEDSPQPGADSPASVASVRRTRRAQNQRRAALEWVVAIVVAVVVAVIIKNWVAQTFVIPSASMRNTLLEGDRVMVSKLAYRFGDISRGDVIVFHNPDCANQQSFCEYAQLIKRVVGVPGDQVTTVEGQLLVNGKALPEPYLMPGSSTTMAGSCDRYGEGELVTVAAGTLLVMGDNRNSSKDGRCFGPVTFDSVIGRAELRVWPVNRIGGL